LLLWTGWTDNILNCFCALWKLGQRAKLCIELRGKYAE
jgi:hypothetical protein